MCEGPDPWDKTHINQRAIKRKGRREASFSAQRMRHTRTGCVPLILAACTPAFSNPPRCCRQLSRAISPSDSRCFAFALDFLPASSCTSVSEGLGQLAPLRRTPWVVNTPNKDKCTPMRNVSAFLSGRRAPGEHLFPRGPTPRTRTSRGVQEWGGGFKAVPSPPAWFCSLLQGTKGSRGRAVPPGAVGTGVKIFHRASQNPLPLAAQFGTKQINVLGTRRVSSKKLLPPCTPPAGTQSGATRQRGEGGGHPGWETFT